MGLWTLVILLPLVVVAVQLRWGNLRELYAFFARWSTPGSGQRIIVFAPHCDDETVGTGGLLRQAKLNGAEVWVVLMTNGDGARYSVAFNNHSLKTKPDQYIELGYGRQRETIKSLHKLGVSGAHVITLGYPDKGLEPMWVSFWEKPYRSPFTKDSSSPYYNSYTPNASYTGTQLLSDIERILKKVNPTDIYTPSPNDQHPDHWATSVFVAEALHDLGWNSRKHVGLYLVHRGDWPVPQGLHKKLNLVPPAALSEMDTKWAQYPLDSATVKSKQQGVEEFKSQSKRFLRSFVRQTELFGTRNPEIDIPKSSGFRVDGRTGDWEGLDPVIRDPSDDGIPAHSQPGADLVAVYAAHDADKMYFRLDFRGAVSTAAAYELRIHPLESKNGTTSVVFKKGRPTPPGWQVSYGMRTIEISCPLRRWHSKPVLIAVATKARWYRVDRSAYRILSGETK